MAGTVRYSEVYGRTADASSPRPPAVNEASGPPEADISPALWIAAMIVCLFVARMFYERAE